MSTPGIVGLIIACSDPNASPHKEVLLVAGKPLMVWTIEAAQNCESIDRVIVCTNTPEIAEVARTWHVEVVDVCPSEFAESRVASLETVMIWLNQQHGYRPDYILLLSLWCPLRTSEDIEAAVEYARNHTAPAVVSVSSIKPHPYLNRSIEPDGTLSESVLDVNADFPEQSFPSAFAPNNAICLIQTDSLAREQTLMPSRTYAYIMPHERALEITSDMEMFLADRILRERHTFRDPSRGGAE